MYQTNNNMSRSNLLLRLKPEFKKGLENNRSKYPEVIQQLEFLLGQQLFYQDLTISQIAKLFTFSDFFLTTKPRGDFAWKFGEDIFFEDNGVC
jgi:hypothetical protein